MAHDIPDEIQELTKQQSQAESEGTKLLEELEEVEQTIEEREKLIRSMQARGETKAAAVLRQEVLELQRKQKEKERAIEQLSGEVTKLETQVRELRERNEANLKDVGTINQRGEHSTAVERAKEVIKQQEKTIEALEDNCKKLRAKLRRHFSSGWW